MLVSPINTNQTCYGNNVNPQAISSNKPDAVLTQQNQVSFSSDAHVFDPFNPFAYNPLYYTQMIKTEASVEKTEIPGATTQKTKGITLDDIGGLSEKTREELNIATKATFLHPELFEAVDVKPEKNILLFGPPGCGKTMIAQALANENHCNFISIKPSDLRSKWVGETEKNISDLFESARENGPTIIFIDEIEALTAMRKTDGGSNHDNIAVNQLLMEMQGINGNNKNVRIIGATNRIDLIDDAIKRDGRFDYVIEIPLPDGKGVEDVFNKINKDRKIEKSFDIPAFAQKLNGMSPASINALSEEAAMNCLRRNGALKKAMNTDTPLDPSSFNMTIKSKDFEKALETVQKRNNLRTGNTEEEKDLKKHIL